MEKATAYERIAWEDRFNRPTVEKLRKGLPPGPRKLFDVLRRQLTALGNVTEDFSWRGACWRWTVEYRIKRRKQPVAVIVPSPEDLQLAVPMERELVRNLAQQRMKRAIRDGIELAQEAFDTRWGVWSIQSENVIDDLLELIEEKLGYEAERVG